MAAMHQDKSSLFSKNSQNAKMHDKKMDLYLSILEKYMTDDISVEDTLRVVDFGTADGGSILPVFKAIFEFVTANFPDQRLEFIFNDKDEKCWGLINHNLEEDNMLCRQANVTVKTRITDFFTDLLPHSSVDIAFCVFVVPWLTVPCPIKSALFRLHADIEEQKILKQQAQEDWENYLKGKSIELKKGGYLVTVLLGELAGGEVETSLEETFSEIFRDKIITKDEYEKICIAAYGRSELEIRRPFQENVVKEMKLIELIPDFIFFKDLGMHNDGVINFYKSLMTTSILSGLSRERTDEEKQEICQIYFDRSKAALKKSENSFDRRRIHYYTVVVQKCAM